MPEGSRLHAARSSSLNGPVRVGVVGLGVMGSEHARVLAASPAAELLGCVDPQPAAARNSPPGVPVFAGIEEMLSATDLEAIVVATPEDAHRGPVEKAFAAGLDVLVEKPIAGCLEDADTLIATANRTGRRLTVGHLLRFDPRYAHVRDEVEAGTLGEIVHLTARRNCLRGEGAVVARRSSLPLYMGVHDLDVMQWFAGPITRVYAEAASRGLVGAGWDTIVATLSFRSGAVGVLELCWALPKNSNQNEGTSLLMAKPSASVVKLRRGADGYRAVGRVRGAVEADRAALAQGGAASSLPGS